MGRTGRDTVRDARRDSRRNDEVPRTGAIQLWFVQRSGSNAPRSLAVWLQNPSRKDYAPKSRPARSQNDKGPMVGLTLRCRHSPQFCDPFGRSAQEPASESAEDQAKSQGLPEVAAGHAGGHDRVR
jgi:hypothetical protein